MAKKPTTNKPADPPAKPKRVRKKKEPTAAEVRKEKARTERALYWRLLQAKKKKLAALKFLAEYQKRNRIEYFNGPHPLVNGKFLRANPKQQLILDAWGRPELKTFVLVGGNRVGKTFLGIIISLSVLKGYWPWNKQPIWFPHKDPRKVRLVCQDWEAAALKVIVPELKRWWPEIWPHTSRKNNMGVESWWQDKETGSTLQIMTSNQDPMLHESEFLDLVWFDEPVSRAHYIANARGLVDRQGRELFTMTLLEQPWIDREICRKKLPDGRPDPSVFVVEAEMTDNIGYGLTQRGVDAFAAKLTEEEREVRIKGVPRYKKGLVYPMFDPKIHCKPRFKVPLDWPVDIAIDTHPRKPHSVLFLATNPHGYKYCIAEIRMHGDGKQLADEIVRMVQWGMYRVNRIIIDPLSKGDDNSPEGSTYHKIAEELGRYDMLLEVASKNKDTGILAVKEHLKGPNDEPSLFFFDDLVYTVSEVEGLMWEKPQLDDKEKAVKEQDDQPENLYRLILLDTEYVPLVDEDEVAGGYERTGVSSTTGY